MRFLYTPVLALVMCFACAGHAFSQAPKARQWNQCDDICLALRDSIRAQPDTLVMRLEDALVIREDCAAEIVTAAIDAVDARPLLVDKIIATALNVTPHWRRQILAAVDTYTPPAALVMDAPAPAPRARSNANPNTNPGANAVAGTPGAASPPPKLEVRRAIVPKEEIRRAAIPTAQAIAAARARSPMFEIRRAIRLTPPPAPAPVPEVRRAIVHR